MKKLYGIKMLNSISAKGLEKLPSSLFHVDNDVEAPQGILVRSADMHEMQFDDNLLCIARAGAGVNNIPLEKCNEQGVVVFNTPGANANAVKELVLAAMVMTCRDIFGGVNWLSTIQDEGDAIPKLVEKGKSKFTGPELEGKTLGVIGLGAIGAKVANMGVSLGMKVLGYDPFISVDGAWGLSRSIEHSVNLSDIITKSDFISLHLPVTADTKGFIGAEKIAQLKQGVRILNFSRGELVENRAILSAIKNGRVAAYATDFPTKELIGKAGVLCFPHLGASTPESEDNCAAMAAEQMREYLVNGNIVNSVNMPNVSLPRTSCERICVLHKNTKGVIAGVTTILNKAEHNIENLTNKSRADYAYTILDVSGDVSDEILAEIAGFDGVIRTRLV